MVREFISDDRLLRVFTFQALYAGVPPHRALAVYAVIAYMDTISGVFFPRGGMRALPDALAAAATDAGVEFRYGAAVSALERSGAMRDGRAHRNRRAYPDRCSRADHRAARHLSPARAHTAQAASASTGAVGRRRARRAATPSTTSVGHHTIVFGDAWEQTFHDIIDDGRLMADPSLLVTRPTAGDSRLAPTGRDLLYILAPAPNTAVGKVDWAAAGQRPTPTACVQTVSDRLPSLGVDAELLHVVDPAGWARQGMFAGTPFALAHTFGQTGPFRPANTVRGIDNAVLAGSSTVPGVGVPTALMSGRLAADRITGAVTKRRQLRVVQTMISSELHAAGVHDPGLREAYRRVPHAQRAARADFLPGHPAARPRTTTRGACAVRFRPARRRHPRRLRSGADRP